MQRQQQQQQQQQYIEQEHERQVGIGVVAGQGPLFEGLSTNKGEQYCINSPVSMGMPLTGSDDPLHVEPVRFLGAPLHSPPTPLCLEHRQGPLVDLNQNLVLKNSQVELVQGPQRFLHAVQYVADSVSENFVQQEHVLAASGEASQLLGGLCAVHPPRPQPLQSLTHFRCGTVPTMVVAGSEPPQLNPRLSAVLPASVSGSFESMQRVGGPVSAVLPVDVTADVQTMLCGSRAVAEAASSVGAASEQLNDQLARLTIEQQPVVQQPLDLHAMEIEMLRNRLALLEAQRPVQQPVQPVEQPVLTPQHFQPVQDVYGVERQPIPGERRWLGERLFEFMPSGVWMSLPQPDESQLYAPVTNDSGVSPSRFESPSLQRGERASGVVQNSGVRLNDGVADVETGDLLGGFSVGGQQVQRQLFPGAVVESSGVPRLVPKEIKLEKPMLFDGKHRDFHNWKFVMLQFLDSSGLGDGPAACRYAVSFLRGDALTWWRAFAKDSTSVFEHLHLDDLMTAMNKQFTDLDRELKVRDQLLSLKQSHSVQQYVMTFQKLQLELGDARLDDNVSLHLFVQGLKPYTRQQVHLQRPENLQDAIQLAERCDQSLSWLKGGARPMQSANHRTASQYSGVRTHGPAPMVLGQVSHSRQQQRPVVQSRPSGTAAGTSVGVKCHHCGKIGHIRKNCFKWQNEQKRQGGGKPASKN